MAGPSSLKTPTSFLHVFSSSLKTPTSFLHVFSIKLPSSYSSSSTLMKLKTLLKTFIFSHVYPISRAFFCKAKSLIIHFLDEMQVLHSVEFPMRKNKQKKLQFGSFRLHYNWCSSHTYSSSRVSYDPGVVVLTSLGSDGMQESDELSRYLEWLGEEDRGNEIDKLADLFIANCHEKFRLEKQESYRRYQEMMARSI